MSLWLVLGGMTLVAIALVAWPLLRPSGPGVARRDYDLRVYRAQLDELEREHERGLIGQREVEAARLEIQRRMLAAAGDEGGKPDAAGTAAARRVTAALLAIALPLTVVVLYGWLGRPDLPSARFADRADERSRAEREAEADPQLPSVETMIVQLEERLAAAPDDFEGWLRLGRAYQLTQQYDQAARAFQEAIALNDSVPQLHADLGETLVLARGGMVGPAARQAFDRALGLQPDDARAQFYTGLADVQAGDREAGLDRWVGLIRSAPADAPWLADLRARTAALAEELGRDPDVLLPPAPDPGTTATAPPAATTAAPRGPSAADVEAAGSMSDDERAAMIRGMVGNLSARLEQEPDNLEGWQMLARSYGVLGEPAGVARALGEVARLDPEFGDAQIAYASALAALEPPLPDQLTAQLQQMLADQSGGADALYQRLVAPFPEGTPQRIRLEQIFEQLSRDP